MYKIPIYQPSLSGREKEYVNNCLDSNWISSKGEYIEKFETAFAHFTESDKAASVSNGTVALHVALVALGIGPGDEVIVPSLTYISPVNAIMYTGATPIFADSLRVTWQIDPDDVRKKITSKTRAIIAVHLYGHPCDMDPLLEITSQHGLFLIEDCAEAIGTKYKGKHVGNFGQLATYSFFGNKTITTGEGGMVTTNSETIHDRIVHFKGQGLAAHRQYWHDVIGYNYRMTNICAAIGLAQLEQANEFLQLKRNIALHYQANLQNLPIAFQVESAEATHSFWMVSIITDDAKHREPLRKHLEINGIETRPLFYPVHTMPMYCNKFQSLTTAEYLGWRGINLPSWPRLKISDIDFICDQIKLFFHNNT